ncbi:MAG: hypothetical protein IT375_07250 [Polyangiaceae bacterium]|nr:hypothetical protein [Polyangiaceae bacterium]
MSLSLDFKSCDEISPDLIERAFAPESGSPRDQVLKLVEKMARVASPGKGAPRILEVLARLAHSAWIEGTLDIVLRDFDLATQIDIRVDVGKHLERLRTVSAAVPLAELAEWATDNPDAIAPLIVFDTRRDDELRLRRASGSITHVPRSSVPHSRPSANPRSGRPQASPVPTSAAPQSSVRRPMAAALRRSVPAPTPAPASAPPAANPEVHARRTLPNIEAESGAADVHRRHTPRVLELELPPEAYPTRAEPQPAPGPPQQRPAQPKPDPRKATIRIPVVRPAAAPTPEEPDPTDEGWE